MHVALVGTYPPTRCGIATFTADVQSILAARGVEVTVVPIVAEALDDRVCIVRDDPRSYERAAVGISALNVDVVVVEHEFGIFGGTDGSHLLHLTEQLTMPYVVTLHTALVHPSAGQTSVLHRVCGPAAAVTVFTESARRLLVEQELVSAAAVEVVPHPAPPELTGAVDESAIRRWLFLPDDAPVMVTFGLLSEGKGIELALRAMQRLEDRHPDLHYVIAGRTHPEVERRDGERYRRELVELGLELGIAERLRFVNQFLDIPDLSGVLRVCDLVCTPYRGEEQAVSGVLTFALAAGCPVVSTPYRYARDLLADGAGRLGRFDDPEDFAAQIDQLLDGPQASIARHAAQRASIGMQWSSVGQTLETILRNALARSNERSPLVVDHPCVRAARVELPVQVRPAPLALDRGHGSTPLGWHLQVLCDDTGILQHAHGRVPRWEDGYCVDDAGRMAAVATWLYRATGDHQWDRIALRMLAFLRSAGHEGGGQMRNFMTWDRCWLDAPHPGDHVGRAMWGLGETICWSQEGQTDPGTAELMQQLVDGIALDGPPRTVMYSALGLAAAGPSMPSLRPAIRRMASAMRAWIPHGPSDWHWWEPRLSYDNARVCEAMIRIGAAVGDDSLIEGGLHQLRWLERLSSRAEHYRVVGHRGLGPGDRVEASGDEQPLDVAALADAALAAFEVTGDGAHLRSIELAWSWFNGNNRLGEAMIDPVTGAGYDGLGRESANRNCGAESTISAIRCWMAVERAGELVGEDGHDIVGSIGVRP